jgi:hypothetical protein
MESIDGRSVVAGRRFLCLFFVLAFSAQLFAAEGEGKPKTDLSVSDELARLTTDAYAYPSGSKRRDALAELALLRELSGDLEGASSAWADAAFAAGEGRDDTALLEAARCLIAIGEIDRAFADLRTVLITGRDKVAISRARYLGAQLSAFRGDEDAVATLSAFVDDDEYADRRATTLYLLWLLTSDGSFRDRLVTDHPKSPEATLASAPERASVSISQTPLWLFFPARGELPQSNAAPLPKVAASPVAPAVPPSTASAAAPPATPPASLSAPDTAEPSRPIALQIGLFRREENAKVLMKKLDTAGFKAETTRRVVGSDEYYAVTVSGGSKPDETALRLKDAGFESFPLY